MLKLKSVVANDKEFILVFTGADGDRGNSIGYTCGEPAEMFAARLRALAGAIERTAAKQHIQEDPEKAARIAHYKSLGDENLKNLLAQYRIDYRNSGPRNHIVESLDLISAELKSRGIDA